MYNGVEDKSLKVSRICHTSKIFKCPGFRGMSRYLLQDKRQAIACCTPTTKKNVLSRLLHILKTAHITFENTTPPRLVDGLKAANLKLLGILKCFAKISGKPQ